MFSRFLVLLIGMSVTGFGAPVQAQQSCDAILARDSIHFLTSDKRRQLAWFKLMNQESYEQTKHDVSGKYKFMSGSYGDASERRNSLLNSEGYNLSEQEAKAELLSGLSDVQVKGWTDCLKGRGNILAAYPTQVAEQGGILIIEWMPGPGVGDLSQLKVEFFGAKETLQLKEFKTKNDLTKGKTTLYLERQPANSGIRATFNAKAGDGAHAFSVSESFYVPPRVVAQVPVRPKKEEVWAVVDEGDIGGVIKAFANGWPISGTIDGDLNTMAHLAVERCDAEMVRFLRDAGASMDRKNKFNDTPRSAAPTLCGAQSETTMATK